MSDLNRPFTSHSRLPSKPTPWLLVLTLLIFATFLFMYKDILIALIKQWIDDENYNHGLLVPVISAFLLYRSLDRVPAERKSSLLAALPLIIPGFMLFAAGQAAAELFTLRSSMLLIFWGLVRGIWGRQTFRVLLFPMLFLVFMIPLPYTLFYRVAFPLQQISATGAAVVLDWMGVPLVRTGNIIHLHRLSIDVVTACSGLRSLLTLITFGTLAAGLFAMRWRLRFLLVFLSIPIAMATNTLRIIITAILVHTSGRAFLEGALHTGIGIFSFIIGIGVLFLLGGSFRWRRTSA